MTQQVHLEFNHPDSLERMRSEMLTAEYRQGRAAHLGHQDFTLVELTDDRIVSQAVVEVELPGWAAKLFTPRNLVTETYTVSPVENGSFSVDCDVEIKNVPATAHARLTLSAQTPCSTSYTVSVEITSNMPMFGSKVEDIVARDLTKNVEGEAEFALKWLEEHPNPDC